MSRRPGQTRLSIAATCAVMLLAVQVLGLHFHRHLGMHSAADSHDAQPALWDAAAHLGGSHLRSAHTGDEAVHAAEDVDVEVSSLAAPQLKLAQIHLAALPPVASSPDSAVRVAAHSAPDSAPRSLPFRLRPPSQAPPVLA